MPPYILLKRSTIQKNSNGIPLTLHKITLDYAILTPLIISIIPLSLQHKRSPVVDQHYCPVLFNTTQAIDIAIKLTKLRLLHKNVPVAPFPRLLNVFFCYLDLRVSTLHPPPPIVTKPDHVLMSLI